MAVIDSAFVSILAIYRSINDSFECIASSNGARIWCFNCNRGVKAISGGCIANSGGAFVGVVARLWGMDTVATNTRIISARIFVVTVDFGENTSRMNIASIFGAFIVVITKESHIFTSSIFVAGISGACISIIASLCDGFTLAIFAFFVGTSIVIIAS
jgi:hypothetical protein